MIKIDFRGIYANFRGILFFGFIPAFMQPKSYFLLKY